MEGPWGGVQPWSLLPSQHTYRLCTSNRSSSRCCEHPPGLIELVEKLLLVPLPLLDLGSHGGCERLLEPALRRCAARTATRDRLAEGDARWVRRGVGLRLADVMALMGHGASVERGRLRGARGRRVGGGCHDTVYARVDWLIVMGAPAGSVAQVCPLFCVKVGAGEDHVKSTSVTPERLG